VALQLEACIYFWSE